MNTILLAIDWHFIDNRIGGERIANLLWCAGIILAAFLLKKPLTKALTFITSKLTARFNTQRRNRELEETIRKPLGALLQTILFYVAISQMGILLNHLVLHRYKDDSKLEITLSDVADHVFLFFTILFVTQFIVRLLDFFFQLSLEKAQTEHNRERQQLLPLMREVTKMFAWTMSFFWILGSVFHVNIPALITGLGIGGVAIALAAKESVENFFAAFTLLSDKPFQTGDSIKMGELEGVIESIGFRSTRLRHADGSVFVIPNKNLVSQTLENQTQRNMRRVRVPIAVRYRLAPGDLSKMISELKEMVTKTAQVLDPVEVNVETFGENSFQVMVIYHLPYPLTGTTLNTVKQEINLQLFDIVDRYTGPKPSSKA
ncbi:mechanosensitive ion channel family protein [Taibaiella soli]|uniref:Mechanosensitive ion channel family protein n=1 Tax=Taibaiella soli TaxID=1649169 RepID=A0A2W2AX50_9BACT|nr:mechanosensitive ion channel family protein [Taibaiella soli]PZF72288.1 hypothetical protein DN068_13070 [Taibaiella soli]